ncbi:hypothetical protein GCM10010182_39910 [Actinomadura cremea]|nr:hypothetical protein GCM10010182_39910 [Actinomadura cremea]
MTRSPRRLKQQVQDTVGEQVRDLPLHAVRLAMFGVGRALLLGDRMTRDYKEITEGGGVKPVIGRLRDDVQHTAEKVVGRVVETVRGGEDAEPEPEPVRPRRTRPARPARPSAAREDGAAVRRRPGGEISVGKPGASDGPVAEPAPSPRPSTPRPEPAPQAEPAAPPVPDGGPAPASAGTAAPDAPAPEAAEPKAAAGGPADAEQDEFAPRPESLPAAQSEAEHVAEGLPVPNYDEATLPQLRARLRGLSVEQVKLLREYERTHAGREDIIKMYERRIAKLNGQS